MKYLNERVKPLEIVFSGTLLFPTLSYNGKNLWIKLLKSLSQDLLLCKLQRSYTYAIYNTIEVINCKNR